MNSFGGRSPRGDSKTWEQYIAAENETKRKHKAEVAARTPNTSQLPIKVGDEVIYSPWYGGLYVGKVVKITAKIVYVGDYGAKPDQVMPATWENRERLRRMVELEEERLRTLLEIQKTRWVL